MHRIVKTFWLILAAILLFYSWVWEKFTDLGRWLLAHLPWDWLKTAVARVIAALPAPVVLFLFIIPALVILPFVSGALVFIAAKFAGVGVAAFIFDIAREKLLSMAWFARVYGWVIAAQHWAHELVAPYKASVKAFFAPLKARVTAVFAGRGKSRFVRRMALLKQRLTRP
jgi:hypothetical protein